MQLLDELRDEHALIERVSEAFLCVMCPAYGVNCRGLELEWWNEWEWDEFEERMGGD